MIIVASEENYQIVLEELALARVSASEADLQAGRFRTGNAGALMREIDAPEAA